MGREEELFRADEAELEKAYGKKAEERTAGWHEKRECEGVDKSAEIEGIAEMAIRAGRDDVVSVHGDGLDGRGSEIGGAPGAQERSGEGEEDAKDEDGDGRRAEADQATARWQRCEYLPGANRVQMQPDVPRCGEADEIDESVDEITETELES